jgi:hypothetical protein
MKKVIRKKITTWFWNIDEAIKGLIENSAKMSSKYVTFESEYDFNGVKLVLRSDSGPKLIYRDWQRAMSDYIAGEVGPYPKKILGQDDLGSDAAIEAKNEEKRHKRSRAYDAKAKTKSRKLKEALEESPPLDVTGHEDDWQKSNDANQDPYGNACCRYAEKWGRLMQKAIAEGKTIPECASDLSHLADDEGITGFMYGAAVSMLSHCWIHGEELRKWHNKEYGVSEDKQGVVNPAVLTIGTEEAVMAPS